MDSSTLLQLLPRGAYTTCRTLPRMLGSATLEDVKKRLLPKFVALSGDEMYRVRKASGECLVDVSRALGVLPWRIHFGDVWMEEEEDDGGGDGERAFYKLLPTPPCNYNQNQNRHH